MANEYNRILLKGTSLAYNALETKNPNSLYFLTDTRQVFLGENLLSQAIEVVDTRPVSPVTGIVYLCKDTGKTETFYEEWITLSLPVVETITGEGDNDHVVTSKAVYDYIIEIAGGVDNLEVIAARGEFEDLGSRLDDIDAKIADILYEPISITSFTNNVNTVEKGSTITSVTLNWNYNKVPKTLMLDGGEISKSLKTTTLTGLSIKANKSFTLKATDDRNAVSSKSTSITFTNGVYYGASAEPAEYNSAFILSLTKALQSSRGKTFTANGGAPGSGTHLWYCVPTSYGKCSFNVGGFDGGFTKVSSITFTNASGFAESYDIYESDNDGLGSTTVKVS